MGLKCHSSLDVVFIWRGKQQMYYQKREADMIKAVLAGPDISFGFMGENVWYEQRYDQNTGNTDQINVVKMNIWPCLNKQGIRLRFGLAVRNDARKIADVEAKLSAKEPIIIGTAYPNIARKRLWDIGIAPVLPRQFTVTGGAESLAVQYPAIDAIFELTQTGDSLRENNLKLIRDNLMKIDILRVERNREYGLRYNGGQDGTVDTTL